jgi:hypothetical protein
MRFTTASDYNDAALQWASCNGHKEVVTLLLNDQSVDTSADNYWAAQSALKNGHKEVLEILLQDQHAPDPNSK